MCYVKTNVMCIYGAKVKFTVKVTGIIQTMVLFKQNYLDDYLGDFLVVKMTS